MNEIVRYEQPKTALEIRAQVNLIQEVMAAVMKEGTHYGKIPGTPKPSLWKPGAEVLGTTFHIAPSYRVEDLSGLDFVRYRVCCIGTHQATGIVMGEGYGECSSMEEKYKWRKASSIKEFEAMSEDRRRIKHGYSREDRAEYEIKQVRAESADQANTILKMACKRAQVAMTLNVTAASDIFTQDIEDLPEELLPEDENQDAPRPVRQPKPKTGKAKTQETVSTNGMFSEGQQRILRARMDSGEITDAQLEKQFKATLANIPAAQFNAVAAWIREMTEAKE